MSSYICRRCKRPLKSPASIQIGMGPTCAAKAGLQTSIMPEDPDVRMLPWKPGGDIIVRREGNLKYMNVPQTIVNHSPTGLEWGYGGSGPADMALNILFMFTGDRAFADRWHQDFKFAFVAGLNREGGTIPGETIQQWIKEKEAAA